MRKIIILNPTGNYLIEVPLFRKIRCKKLPSPKLRGHHVDLVVVDEVIQNGKKI